MSKRPKVLFILKCRGLPYTGGTSSVTENNLVKIDQKTGYSHCISSGLFNSANLVSEMLIENGIESKVVQVIDANCIDREVHRYKPTHVMIEALWAVPEKFKILQKLHPNVKWIIRLHSETPFIANEGISMEWIFQYVRIKNVFLAPNSTRMYNDLVTILTAKHGEYFADGKLVYLPNFYKIEGYREKIPRNFKIDVGCFGAIRPLKNQLTQAIAAIEFAKRNRVKLRFHINSSRIENSGNNVLKNIRNLFNNLDPINYELVEHDWLSRPQFLELIRKMDIGLQVSFSETFNIVTADFVSQNIPVVTSKEIDWVSSLYHAEPTSVNDIVKKMNRALRQEWFGTYLNKIGLNRYNYYSAKTWLDYLKAKF
jgi:hypothetical protein